MQKHKSYNNIDKVNPLTSKYRVNVNDLPLFSSGLKQ